LTEDEVLGNATGNLCTVCMRGPSYFIRRENGQPSPTVVVKTYVSVLSQQLCSKHMLWPL